MKVVYRKSIWEQIRQAERDASVAQKIIDHIELTWDEWLELKSIINEKDLGYSYSILITGCTIQIDGIAIFVPEADQPGRRIELI